MNQIDLALAKEASEANLGGAMDHSLRGERKQIVASDKAFHQPISTPLSGGMCASDVEEPCSTLMRRFGFTETDSAWSVRLPFCACEYKSSSTMQDEERSAA
ncbi:MAG TPA: hypothetical protein VJQ54_01835 [Candidatus Sulfotelmatobacter sp.]|nr:hypothetical protein [Candidatus Sulfotelmatobacter sp.]